MGKLRYLSVGVTLFGFWLVLSGHHTVFLLTSGFVCAFLAILLSARMRIIDAEGHPVELIPGLSVYWPWLILEVFKSAWSVTRIVLSPSLPVSPTLTFVKMSQDTALGTNIYANSVTFTPGTIAVRVSLRGIVVHALTTEMADHLEQGEMDMRVKQIEKRG